MKRNRENLVMGLALLLGIVLSAIGGAALTLAADVHRAAHAATPPSCEAPSPSDLLAILRAVLSAAGSLH